MSDRFRRAYPSGDRRRLREISKFWDGPGMMRQEKLLIRLQGRLDLDIREDQRSISFPDEGNPDAIEFPRAKIEDCPYDFSFSGVKSAVLNYLNHAQMTGEEVNRADHGCFFPESGGGCTGRAYHAGCQRIMDMDKVAIAGGVASNGTLRERQWKKACKENGLQLLPSVSDFLYR